MATTVSLGELAARRAWPSARIARIWSPSTTLPVVVDGQAAVGVAVEREARVGAVLERRPSAARSRWVEPQPSLMLSPSGSAWIATTSAPASRSARGPASEAAPCGAVEDDLEPRRAGRSIGARPGGRRTRSTAASYGAHPADVAAGRAVPRPRASRCSIAASMASSSLTPPRARNLMPLSGIGLWEAESITPRSAPSAPVR